MEKYFFDDGRTCWGPVQASRIVELYEEGILSSQSPIRLCGTPEWQKLEDMVILFNACCEARERRTEKAETQTISLRRVLTKMLSPSRRDRVPKSAK